MRIFKDIIGKIDIRYSDTFTSLTNCCEYFKLKSNENNFHNALFDSFMTSRMICKIYETLDKAILNNKKFEKESEFTEAIIQYTDGLKSTKRKFIKEHIIPLANKIATKKWGTNE